MTRATTKKANKPTKSASSKSKAKLEKAKQKLLIGFRGKLLDMSSSVLQSLEILDAYMKRHIMDAEPALFREILRMVHKVLPSGPQKTKIRGVLGKNEPFYQIKIIQ